MDRSLHVLLLCTGNICRSPMAEGLLRSRLATRGVEATVASAGLTFDARPPTPEAVDAASAYGVDIGAHRSRIMSAELLREADLVIAMERLHAREAFVLDRSVIDHCFTLKELVRRGDAAGPRRSHESLADWLERLGAARRSIELIGSSADDDIADPFQCGREVYERCIAELDRLIARLVDLAWPAPAAQTAQTEGVA